MIKIFGEGKAPQINGSKKRRLPGYETATRLPCPWFLRLAIVFWTYKTNNSRWYSFLYLSLVRCNCFKFLAEGVFEMAKAHHAILVGLQLGGNWVLTRWQQGSRRLMVMNINKNSELFLSFLFPLSVALLYPLWPFGNKWPCMLNYAREDILRTFEEILISVNPNRGGKKTTGG